MNPDTQKAIPEAQVLKKALQAYQRSRRKSILGDLIASVKEARPFRVWQALLSYFRRARAISFFFRAAGWILAILRTGTLLLLTTVLFFIVLPLLLTLLIGFLLAAFWDMKKSLSKLLSAIGERPVWVFFSVGKFGTESALSLSTEERLCLIVSPHWISPKGGISPRFYLNLRAESENCYLVRRYFYLRLYKKLHQSDQLVLVY